MTDNYADSPDQIGGKASKGQDFWRKQITRAESFQRKWREHADKVYRRYEDDRQEDVLIDAGVVKANLFYSNVQTLKESLYNSPPKPDVKRLQGENYQDDVARVAAMMVQRGLTYEIHCAPSFDGAIKAAILDRLVPGIGQVWVSFDVDKQADENDAKQMYPVQGTETTYVENVYWQDFLYSPARCWEKVWWVARKLHLTRDEMVEKYGEKKIVGLAAYQASDNKTVLLTPKEINQFTYCVYEIWDKRSKKVYHYANGAEDLLKVMDDPMGFKDFFPCPKPLIANVTTNKFLPVTDYHIAQDQYNQLDILYQRINALVRVMRVVGVYDSSYSALQRVFDQPENTFVPVDDWAAYAEKGGIVGAIQLLPVEQVSGILQQLMAQFEATKNLLYEITGMSDIVRGASNQYETAAAQQIKAQFASVRLNAYQRDVAVFVRDTLRLVAEVVFQLYSPKKVEMIVGELPEPDQQFIPQAVQVLQSDYLSKYAVDIEADSLTQADWALEKDQRMNIVQTLGGMIGQMMPMAEQVPELAPLAVQLILFGISGFKGSYDLQGYLERTMEDLMRKNKEAAANPQPSPEEQKMQAEQQKMQMEAQIKQQEAQSKMAMEQQKNQMEIQMKQLELAHQQRMDEMELQMKRMEMILEQQKAAMELQVQGAKNAMALQNQQDKNELQKQQQTQKGED